MRAITRFAHQGLVHALLLSIAVIPPKVEARPPDLCASLPAAEIEKVLKEKVVSTEPLKYTSGCTYVTARAGYGVRLNFLNTGGDAKEEFAGQRRLQSSAGKVQIIAGLGDEAFFGMVLVVRAGERVLMVEPQPLDEAHRREQARALAQLALGKKP